MYALIEKFFEDTIAQALSPTYLKLENIAYQSTNGVPYAKLSHLRGPRRSSALGSKQILYQGIVQVDVMTQANSGPGSSEGMLSRVEAGFDNGMQFDISGSQLSIMSVSRGVSSEDPVWYTVPVSIYWSLRKQQ